MDCSCFVRTDCPRSCQTPQRPAGCSAHRAVGLSEYALGLNPNLAVGWYNRGMIRLYAGQPDAAIDSFEASLRLNPRDRIGRRNIGGIGIAYLLNQRFDEAVPMLRLAVDEFPNWATPYGALAACCAHMGLVGDVQAVAQRLRASDPSLEPKARQFRNAAHRELLIPGLRLLGLAGRPSMLPAPGT